MYASVADLRAEGVTVAEASDARLELLLDEASRLIDRVTGWFFEPRLLTLRLSGRGAPSIELPVPPIRVDRLLLGSAELSLDPSELFIVGAPIQPGFDGPRFTRRHGLTFPHGHGNVVADSNRARYDRHPRSCWDAANRRIRPSAPSATCWIRNANGFLGRCESANLSRLLTRRTFARGSANGAIFESAQCGRPNVERNPERRELLGVLHFCRNGAGMRASAW